MGWQVKVPKKARLHDDGTSMCLDSRHFGRGQNKKGRLISEQHLHIQMGYSDPALISLYLNRGFLKWGYP